MPSATMPSATENRYTRNRNASNDTSSGARTLRIRTGAVERTMKDLESYREEVKDIERRIDALRAGDDQSKLKQWETVLAETHAMIPDSTSRLVTAIDELSKLVERMQDDHQQTAQPVDISQVDAAKQTLSNAEQLLKG